MEPAMKRPRGEVHGFFAYLIWGLFPLYFSFLSRSSPFEVVAYRIVCSLIFVAAIVTVLRLWPAVARILRDRKATITFLAAGVLVSGNWALYIWAVNHGLTLDCSLGYFINPLINAAFGMIFFGEKLRRLQYLAFAVGTVAVIVLVIGYGRVPWVAFGLALSFACYGMMKKRLGAKAGAFPGLVVETSATAPFALAFLVYLAIRGTNTGHLGDPYLALLAFSGVMTAVPLLLFATATARVPLTTIAILQYIGPLLQFLTGWLLFGEAMPASRWAGFIIIWTAIALFTIDLIHQGHTRPKTN